MKVDYTRYYRHWHNDSPEHFAAMVGYYGGRLAVHLPADRNTRLLDVGCGMGFALEALRVLGYTQLEGIDPDEGQVAAARAGHRPVSRVEDTAAWLHARPGQYDAILLLDVLEHIPREEQFDFLAALHGALAPGGRLICSVPNANSTLAARHRYNDWTHRVGFTEHSLEFALHHGGFRDIQVLADDGAPMRLPWVPHWRRRWWYVRSLFRAVRRLQLMAELGPEEGRRVPLSLNLLGVATK